MMLPTYHRATASARRAFVACQLAAAVVATSLSAPRTMWAQSAPPAATESHTAELLAAGDRESLARHPALALPYYERAIQQDAQSATALWKASRELVDMGEFEPKAETRFAYYAKATEYARKAVTIAPADAEPHFHLARALGRTALALGPRDRVKYGIDVRAQALRALELAPRHPGALHVMGVWNAEVMRLNSIARLVAKAFMGGKIFETASWAEATRYMEQAVAVEPERMVHRLDLARVYRDVGRKADARAAYNAAIAAALIDANDERYREDARRELAALGK